jgi:hypothetical protein
MAGKLPESSGVPLAKRSAMTDARVCLNTPLFELLDCAVRRNPGILTEPVHGGGCAAKDAAITVNAELDATRAVPK